MLHTLLRPTKKQWFALRIIVIAALLGWVVGFHGQKPPGKEAGFQDSRLASDQNNSPNPLAPKPSSAKNDPNAGLTVQDSATTFKLRVNLVQVHVVVRDTRRNPVGNLRQEDFELYDQGKLQPLSLFTAETGEALREKTEAAALTQTSERAPANNSNTLLPDRFIARYCRKDHETGGCYVPETDSRRVDREIEF